jgi:hypothetical protein
MARRLGNWVGSMVTVALICAASAALAQSRSLPIPAVACRDRSDLAALRSGEAGRLARWFAVSNKTSCVILEAGEIFVIDHKDRWNQMWNIRLIEDAATWWVDSRQARGREK